MKASYFFVIFLLLGFLYRIDASSSRFDEPENVQINKGASTVTLTWQAVPDAMGYRVYCSDSPDGDYSEDLAGAGSDTFWITPSTAEKKFYRIKAIFPDSFDQLVFVNSGGFMLYLPTSYYVNLSSFYIDKYEVTQASYQSLMGSNPSSFTSSGNLPVERVSWFKAIEYCNRLSASKNLSPCYSYGTFGTNPDNWPTGWNTTVANQLNITCDWTLDGYRLPTEAEWVFAYKGGTQSQGYTYSGSNTLSDVAWYNANSGGTTHAVGTRMPNELGLYDMSGNVREWVWDAYYYQYPSGTFTNPTGNDPSGSSSRIYLGGSWNDSNSSWQRSSISPTSSSYYMGFRVCRKALLGRVEAPVIDPTGGLYQTPTLVTITCPTEGAQIRYTLDGSEPGQSSQLYEGAFLLSEIKVVKARAFKPDWLLSEVTSARIRVILPLEFDATFVTGGRYYLPRQYQGEWYYPEMTVSNFYMERHETTLWQYYAIMDELPETDYGPNLDLSVWGIYPLHNVSWLKVLEYCNRRSLLEDLTPCYSYGTYGSNPDNWPPGWHLERGNSQYIVCDWNANGYRMPTASEWEYAALGGNYTHYYTYVGSNDILEATPIWTPYTWWDPDAFHVGISYSIPNELNLINMGWNASEACWDNAGLYSLVDQWDYRGPVTPAWGGGRSVLGGSFYYVGLEHYFQIALARGAWYLEDWQNIWVMGIRLVRSAPTEGVVQNPEINLPAGSFNTTQFATITCSTPGADIYYTLDGSIPSASYTLYTGPVILGQSCTLKAVAIKPAWIASQVVSSNYTFVTMDPVVDIPSGYYPTTRSVTITCATLGSTIRYTTDGSEPSEDSAVYTVPIVISNDCVLKARAYKTGWLPSSTLTAAYFITLVYVPAGTFTMGWTNGYGTIYEFPPHEVTLSAFYISKYELTQGEWLAYLPLLTQSEPNHPAVGISWYAIIKYCNLLSMNDGFTPVYSINGSTNPADWGTPPNIPDPVWDAVVCNWSANGYRLPTEAEWEYAARGATNNPDYMYSGSNDINAVAWYEGNAGSGLPGGMNHPDYGVHQVGTKAPNALGIYDMSGNMWEYCWDWLSNSYYTVIPSINPTGPTSGTNRVKRGGDYNNIADWCQVNRRGGDIGDQTYLTFRLSRTAP